uniref:Beta-galactosidase-1-like protein 2 n=1 Tax=Canis lupus dingo TaxID=286419 RepID=A0A8C0K3W2_CANLU
ICRFIVFIKFGKIVALFLLLFFDSYLFNPSWLLRDPKMKLRTTYKGFTKAVNHYFDKIIPMIVQLQYAKGGPIIAVQVENEYGSYHQDKRYLKYIKKVSAPLTFLHIYIFLISLSDLTKWTLHFSQGRSPILMMVYTARSLDGWGTAPHFADSHSEYFLEVREMFNASFSLNFYMFHGGTNFGFMGGSASLDNYLPMITSYGKYLCPAAISNLGIPKHPQPDSIPKATYKSVITPYYISLWDVMPYLEEPISSVKPICMEKLSVNQGSGQSSGYVLYETMIISGGLLTTKGHLQDRGQRYPLWRVCLGQVYKNNPTLRILVENQGRLAYGQNINKERKGLIGDIYLNNSPLRKFKIYSLDMKTKFLRRDLPNIWKPVVFKHQGPAFFLGILRMGNYPRDTFIKMEGWTKGVIFINGQNLGRYWNIGPQETLYLPGPWLRPGSNEIIVFEEFKPGLQIHFTNMSHLGMVPWRANCSI